MTLGSVLKYTEDQTELRNEGLDSLLVAPTA